MRESMHRAAARRDDRLAKIRRLSLWITGGAAAASVGLGTAFAHALPGHPTTNNTSTSSTSTGGSAGSAAPGSTGTGQPAATPGPSGTPASHRTHKLAPPASTPAPTQQAPVVQSGGS